MPYFAVTDSDWDWDDTAEGTPYIIEAETAEKACELAAHRLLVEDGTADGCYFKVAELIVRGFIGCEKTGVDTFKMDEKFVPAMDAVDHPLLDWAVERWKAEVSGRPLGNVHRRSLDDTWRQVVRAAGGKPEELIGPPHDVLLAADPLPARVLVDRNLLQAAIKEIREWKISCGGDDQVVLNLEAILKDDLHG